MAETRRGPGTRAGLTADAVLEAGRDLVEREGVEALTMRRLADRLGVAPNSLYSHFADKSALLDGILDSLLAEIEVPNVDRLDWRGGLIVLMTRSRSMLLDHADLLPHLFSRPMRGPQATRLGEATLALLARGGIEGIPAVDALRALLTFTFGSVALDAPRRAERDPDARRRASAAALASDPSTPRMAELADPLSRPPADGTFQTGLSWLIDGIERTSGR
jgi:TetR/AcrR family tetracycline transcriptional repressor